MPDRGLRSQGMRDLGPQDMAQFRAIERAFLTATEAAGYREVRTPAIEPLHLYSASGTLSPQALERVYSFLDWNGWSGERVVLRPDTTVAVARWYVDSAASGVSGGAERVSYVQPVFRFAAEGEREVWQCGVELFGVATGADAEVLTLAREFLRSVGIEDVSVELAHAGLARAVFAAAGLSAREQLVAYGRLLDGDAGLIDELAASHPDGGAAMRLLADVDGSSVGYVANLRASMPAVVPDADAPIDDLGNAAAALDAAGVPYRILSATARNFEYYTGITFRFMSQGRTVLSGGRYDRLAETLGGAAVPACGWAANLLGLIEASGESGAVRS